MAEREAQAITERGRQEAHIAGRGGYSERPDRISIARMKKAGHHRLGLGTSHAL